MKIFCGCEWINWFFFGIDKAFEILKFERLKVFKVSIKKVYGIFFYYFLRNVINYTEYYK